MQGGLPLSVYGIVVALYLSLKLVGYCRYRPFEQAITTPPVSVIIATYNEDPALMRACLDSILDQPYPVAEVFITDDGSEDKRAWRAINQYAARDSRIVAHRFPENRGKRHAQAYGFARATGDLFVTVDSDSILEPNALAELVKPFADQGVTAVTGYPKILDRERTLLSRLIDMRYWSSFNVDRGAQSVLGITTCCTGVFSAYRADIVREVLTAYVEQKFLGKPCHYGDDRHLTAHALKRGKVVFQSTAQAWTAAPDGFPTYVRQQTRWMRSFWRESLLALAWAPKRSIVLAALMVVELSLPLALLGVGVGTMLYRVFVLGALASLGMYLLAIAVMAYLRNLAYSRRHLGTFLIAPLYGVLFFTVHLPLLLYALVTLRTTHWGTRQVTTADAGRPALIGRIGFSLGLGNLLRQDRANAVLLPVRGAQLHRLQQRIHRRATADSAPTAESGTPREEPTATRHRVVPPDTSLAVQRFRGVAAEADDG
ncbi:glycosyltransferase [Haladaptatus sp. DJG-WS-42]|uniref:glycosyltransferase n=1 Tax=Haladaptatus sp. DJG-WS-42 TaxID=3120516 RepID=UPI0030CCAAE9